MASAAPPRKIEPRAAATRRRPSSTVHPVPTMNAPPQTRSAPSGSAGGGGFCPLRPPALLRRFLPVLLLTVGAAPLLAGCGDGEDGRTRPDAAASDPAPEDRAAIDSVYHRFSRAYDLLDADSVAGLYTEDALYLPAGGDLIRGRRAIRADFSNFFDELREQDVALRISFSTVDRHLTGDLAYDVGYYTLESAPSGREGSPPVVSRGKFTTVWRKGVDGTWRIHVDAFSPAPAEDDADTTGAEPS